MFFPGLIVMKRKTVMFFVILCFLLAILAFSFQINIWEESAKTGFAQVVFIAGVLVGMVFELVIIMIDSRIPE